MPNNKFAKLPKPQKQFLRSFFQPAATSYLDSLPVATLEPPQRSSRSKSKFSDIRLDPATGLFAAVPTDVNPTLTQLRTQQIGALKAETGSICRQLLRKWTPTWIAEQASNLESSPLPRPITLRNPAIEAAINSVATTYARRVAKKLANSEFAPTLPPDPDVIDTALALDVIPDRFRGSPAEHIRVQTYNAIAHARTALQYLADERPALALWYGDIIREDPTVKLPDDPQLLINQAYAESGISPGDWDLLNQFNKNRMRRAFETQGRLVAILVWSSITDLAPIPPDHAIDVATRQISRLRAKPRQTVAPTSQIHRNILRAFFAHYQQSNPQGTGYDRVAEHRANQFHQTVTGELNLILQAAASSQEETTGSTLPQKTWSQWQAFADIPPPNPKPQSGHNPNITGCQVVHFLPDLADYEQILINHLSTTDTAPQPTQEWRQPTNSATEPTSCTVSTLKERGWTDRLIQALLGEPDQLAPNPHYSSAAPMRLYLRQRIEEAEQHPTFTEALNKFRARREAGRKSANTRIRKAVQWAANTPIPFRCPTRSIRELNAVSMEARNELADIRHRPSDDHDWDDDYESPPLSRRSSDQDSLARITVNFLRHECSSYDFTLAETFGKSGKALAITVIRLRIYREIARHWPVLKAECNRKIAELGPPDFH